MSIDPTKMYIISLDARYGAESYKSLLEYEYFPPFKKELNDLYNLKDHQWNGQTWTVLTLPKGFKKTAKDIANDFGMQLVNGRPYDMMSKTYFPYLGDGDYVYNLENRGRPGRHHAPLLTETQLMVRVIKIAEKKWKVNFSEAVQMIENLGVTKQKTPAEMQKEQWHRLLSQTKF